MKRFMSFTIGFITIILVGYFLNENIKKATATSIGYSGYYNRYIGRCMFYNDSMESSYDKIRKSYTSRGDTSQAFRKDKEWVQLVKLDERNYAIIESSGNLFTLLMSITGFMIWFIRRRRKILIKCVDWLALMMSLFFLRETIVIGIDLIAHRKLCDEAKFWKYLGLNCYYSDLILFWLGIILLLFILFYVVPKNYRLTFILSGFLGSIISFILIVRFLGHLLL